MTEETLASPASAEDVPETTEAVTETTEQKVVEPDTNEQQETQTEETAESAPETEEKPERPKPNPVQDRIDQITRKRREAERNAKELEATNQRLKERLAKYETPEPKLEDFEFDETRYQAALNAHNFKQLRKDELADDVEQSNAQIEAASKEAEDSKRTAYGLRAQAFAETAPDFDQVVSSSSLPVSDEVSAQIIESDLGPQLAYYLAKNPSEAANVAHLTDPLEAARAIGRLEARLTQPPPKRTTQAPPPLKPIAGNTGTRSEFDPNSGSLDDFAKQLKKAGVI